MKTIIRSAVLVFALAAVFGGATVAYLSDAETSEGNVFTAGSIDLKVDAYVADGDGTLISGFDAKDLNGETIFTLSDIKPSDNGRLKFSLHITDNPAWACVLFNGTDDENGLKEPESQLGDTDATGELSDAISVTAWIDGGDGNFTGSDTIVYNGPLKNLKIVAADSETADAIAAGGTRWVAMRWCAGTQGGAPDFACDGEAMTSVAQSDKYTADILFYAEQEKNNDLFKCADVNVSEL